MVTLHYIVKIQSAAANSVEPGENFVKLCVHLKAVCGHTAGGSNVKPIISSP